MLCQLCRISKIVCFASWEVLHGIITWDGGLDSIIDKANVAAGCDIDGCTAPV
jgi:hypothetical protein